MSEKNFSNLRNALLPTFIGKYVAVNDGEKSKVIDVVVTQQGKSYELHLENGEIADVSKTKKLMFS